MAEIKTVVLITVEIIIYTFHASILVLLFCKRKTSFSSPFFNILRCVFIADLLCIIQSISFFNILIISNEFLKNLPFLASIIFNSGTYITFLQYLGHFFMALNRFTAFWFPFMHKRIWLRQWYTILLLFIPFLHICYRLHEPGEFKGSSAVIKNSALRFVILQYATIIYMVITSITAIINILTFIKLYFFNQTSNAVLSNEKTLFGVTCFIFFAQAFRVVYGFGNSFFASNETVAGILSSLLPLTNDFYAWAGSISLAFLSATTRKEYLRFYFGIKKVVYPTSFPPSTIISSKNIVTHN